MAARGEIGFLVIQIGFNNTRYLSEEAFTTAIWAIILNTIIGPVAVGFLIKFKAKSIANGSWGIQEIPPPIYLTRARSRSRSRAQSMYSEARTAYATEVNSAVDLEAAKPVDIDDIGSAALKEMNVAVDLESAMCVNADGIDVAAATDENAMMDLEAVMPPDPDGIDVAAAGVSFSPDC
jgi:hypothetical protein